MGMKKQSAPKEFNPQDYDLSCFGDRLRYCLDKQEMTQGELGVIVDLTAGAISQFCAIKKPSGHSKKMKAMAEALGVDLMWLQHGVSATSGTPEQPVLGQKAVLVTEDAKSFVRKGLSALQEATLQNLEELMKKGRFDDMACLDLLTLLKPKLAEVK